MSSLKPLIVILGPTSSGKTEMGLRLAKQFNGEIINADSRQIYKEMLIATGSPITTNRGLTHVVTEVKPLFIKNIPHHLFHIKNPNQKFSLLQYKKLAIKTINDIHKKNKIPILVGGTGLYISAIVDNLEIPKATPNKNLRIKLEKHTNQYLFNKLKKIDPESTKKISENNKRKLIRALEVCEITGKAYSVQQTKGKILFNILQIGIKTNREQLYKKIDKRVDRMTKEGLVEETKKLRKKYSSNLPAMSGIGYFEIGLFIKGKIDLKEAIQKIKYRTHQYARRQMTWFKRDEKIKWVRNYRDAKKIIKKIYKNFVILK
ncbi:MAG: tRNA (adenosine(37)-N6)-dimethylallyltransferase MiaA [Patescibacteria group bacterium]|nr:tRNA (adenosine(37)-N6)-dimethylallyltransferase MiaA [Patescibacteria group bacterium]